MRLARAGWNVVGSSRAARSLVGAAGGLGTAAGSPTENTAVAGSGADTGAALPAVLPPGGVLGLSGASVKPILRSCQVGARRACWPAAPAAPCCELAVVVGPALAVGTSAIGSGAANGSGLSGMTSGARWLDTSAFAGLTFFVCACLPKSVVRAKTRPTPAMAVRPTMLTIFPLRFLRPTDGMPALVMYSCST